MTVTVADRPPPYSAIVFDCDSTLSRIEGIEELGVRHAEEFAQLTRAAMDGDLPLEAVYERRLVLAAPTRDAVLAVGKRYVEEALPNARSLVAALLALDKHVAIVSGGVLPAVRVLGEHLGIRVSDVHAVDLSFDESGEYAGFDATSPLARAGGKLDVVRDIAGPGAACLIGDGATDLEAAEVCARFVAFGGVARREVVFRAARVSCEAADLAALLPLVLAPAEIETLAADPTHADLVHAARPWL